MRRSTRNHWAGWAAGLLLAGCLSGCGGVPAAAEYAGNSSQQEELPSPEQYFSAYREYGLSYDAAARQLTYNGQAVRYFEDLYPVSPEEPDLQAGMTFFDKTGTLDVLARRDLTNLPRNEDGSYDPSGKLLGVTVCTQTEFDARDISALKAPQDSVAIAGTPLTEAERAAKYAPYAAYGMTYDAGADTLTMDGQLVRCFVDVYTSNGEEPASGRFSGRLSNHYTEGGTIDVNTVRDRTQKDKDGNDLLTGLRVLTQPEFDTRTASLQDDAVGGVFRYYNGNITQEGEA